VDLSNGVHTTLQCMGHASGLNDFNCHLHFFSPLTKTECHVTGGWLTGNPTAQHKVATALLEEGSTGMALTYFESAAKQHHAPSLLKLADLTMEGSLGMISCKLHLKIAAAVIDHKSY
jgi:hypothetical protein